MPVTMVVVYHMKIMVPCLCCFLNIAVNTYAQNLVPNPGLRIIITVCLVET